MLVRKVRPEDGLEYDKTQALAFRFPIDIAKRVEEIKTAPGPKWERSWAAFADNGDMAACLQIHDFECNFDGSVVGLSGVGGVATRPEYRRGGAIRELFRAWMAEKRESGVLLSGLYPFSHEFYRKFGYETALVARSYRLRPASLAAYRPFYTGGARMYTEKTPDEETKALVDAFGARYNFSMRRSAEAWSRWTDGDDFSKMRFCYKLSDDQGLCAWCITRVGRDDGKEFLNVTDVAWRDTAGFKNLLGFLSLTASDMTIHLRLPEDVPLTMLLPEPYDVTYRTDSTPMVRVLDVKRALTLMKHPAEASYGLYVRDEFLPENDGAYTVNAKDDAIDVRRGCVQPDIEMSVQTFAQLSCGSIDIRAALLRPDVRLHGNCDALSRVFTRRPVWHPDHY